MRAILEGAMHKETWPGRLRHFSYAAGWKKFEPLWDFVIRARQVAHMRPVLKRVLGNGRPRPQRIDLETRSTSDISLKVFSP